MVDVPSGAGGLSRALTEVARVGGAAREKRGEKNGKGTNLDGFMTTM
jgi:hypothetical protein